MLRFLRFKIAATASILSSGCAIVAPHFATHSLVEMRGFSPQFTAAVMGRVSEVQRGLCPWGKALEERRADARPEYRDTRYQYLTPPRTEVRASAEVVCR